MSAAEMALGARVDGLVPRDVQSALWRERTLVKTWLMRGTLHLVPAVELPLRLGAFLDTEVSLKIRPRRCRFPAPLFDQGQRSRRCTSSNDSGPTWRSKSCYLAGL